MAQPPRSVPSSYADTIGDPLTSSQSIRIVLNSAADQNRLEFLAKLPIVLNSSLSISKVISVALERLQEEVQAERVTICLLSRDGRSMELRTRSAAGHLIEQKSVALPREGALGWVLASGRPLYIQDNEFDRPLLDQIGEANPQLRSAIMIPLLVRGQECLGVLEVFNRQDECCFKQDDFIFTEQFAHQVALAIDNARLFQEAREQNDKLVALSRQKSEMISIIAHEFRTPLNIIQNAAELILSPELNDETRERVSGFLKNGVIRLTRLLAQVRHVALVQDAQIKLEQQTINLSELLIELGMHYRGAAKSRNLNLAIDTSKTDLHIKGDYELLMLVLQNLLGNAIRFTPDGGSISVAVGVQESNEVEIAVTDTGIGIDEAHLPMIFEKFYECGNSLEHFSGEHEFKSGGLGLGLAIAQHIVQAHGSAIEVRSKLHHGSTFSFRLPLHRP